MENAEKFLAKTAKLLELQGETIDNKPQSEEEMLISYILPGMENSKEILSGIYSQKTRSRKGILGRIKGFLHQKLINIVINVIERPMLKQQKFNDLTYKAIEILSKRKK